jgi:L-alanine-DL-glutamate epimerase-like enolase superfamily enzyme
MTTTLNVINLSDVPLVDPQDLALAMQYMIDAGRGLAMLRGVSKEDLREVDHALWDALADDPVQRLAVLMRFRCLVRVFGARRLADLLLNTGHNLIAPAVQVAARMRLNADLGFNPLKFERALRELMAKIAQGQRRSAETSDLLAA